jgi:excisionase family DNA binding protein
MPDLALSPASAAPLLYSPREAQKLLGVSHATLYRLIRSKQLDARKIGTATRITAQSIELFLLDLPKVGSQG